MLQFITCRLCSFLYFILIRFTCELLFEEMYSFLFAIMCIVLPVLCTRLRMVPFLLTYAFQELSSESSYNRFKQSVKKINTWMPDIKLSGHLSTMPKEKVYLHSVTECMRNSCVHFPRSDSMFEHGKSSSMFKFDPLMFHGADAFPIIRKYLIDACRDAGFGAHATSQSKKGARGNRLANLHISCNHNRCAQKSGKTMVYKTCRPAPGMKPCEFSLRAYCYKDDGCWYLLCDEDKCQGETERSPLQKRFRRFFEGGNT